MQPALFFAISPRNERPPRMASTLGTLASLTSEDGFGNS